MTMTHTPHVAHDEDPVPVTVYLTADQHARLETLIDCFRVVDPDTAPHEIVDAVFLLGLQQAEGSTTSNTELTA